MQAYGKPLWQVAAARLALACVSALLALPALELGYRLQSHRPVLALDDWRAERIEFNTFGDQGRFDRELGWIPREWYESDDYNTLDYGIRRNAAEAAVRTGGILAVGDVFTNGGTEVSDEETWPAILEQTVSIPVVNGGVAGYASDQIILRAEQLLPVVRPRTLVVGLFEDDIKRASFSSYGAAKPYFTMKDGSLTYHAPAPVVPKARTAGDWHAMLREIMSHSAVLDVVLSRVAPTYWLGKTGVPVFHTVDNDPVAVTCALLRRLKTRAEAEGVHMLLLMQHARQTIAERTEPPEDARKVSACAAAVAIEVIDQFDSLRAIAAADPTALASYYLDSDGYGQLSSMGNQHVADLIARALNHVAAVSK